MKKLTFIAVSALILSIISLAPPAQAVGDLAAKKFSNCAALNKVYPGGVALSRSSVNRGGTVKYSPKVSSTVYKENKSKDRDRDGIACER